MTRIRADARCRSDDESRNRWNWRRLCDGKRWKNEGKERGWDGFGFRGMRIVTTSFILDFGSWKRGSEKAWGKTGAKRVPQSDDSGLTTTNNGRGWIASLIIMLRTE